MKQGNATSRKNKIANKNSASKGQQALKALATSGKTSRKTSSSSFLSNIILVVIFAVFLLLSLLSDETQSPSTPTVRGSAPTSTTRVNETSFANVQITSTQIVDADDNDDGASDTKENESEDEEEEEPEKEEDQIEDIPTQISTNSTLNDTKIEEVPQKKKKDPLEGWIYEPKNVNYFW